MSGIDSLLRPTRVAVIGASNQVDKIGGRPIHFMLRHGYQGEIIPINPAHGEVQGLRAFPDIESAPAGADVAILAVSADLVDEMVARCAAAGVKTAIIFASGFSEIGDEGDTRQAALANHARAAGMRLVGPNSIGVANFRQGAILTFASGLIEAPPEDGPVAIISQSGAFGVAAYAELRERGIGVRYLCATGNQADLCVSDFLLEIAGDSDIRVALLYVENFPDEQEFIRAAAAATTAGIRIMAVASGLSPHGRRSAILHSGGAQHAPASRSILRASGIRVAEDLIDLVDETQSALTDRPHLPARPRLGLISNSGASCVLAADAAEALGLRIAALSPRSNGLLDAILPAFSLNRNPIDLTAMLLGKPDMLAGVLDIVLSDPEVDIAAIGLLAIGGRSYDVDVFARASLKVSDRHGKPVVAYAPSGRVRSAFRRAGIATFASEREALAFVRSCSADGDIAKREPT
jgi:acyl-CoA synthetase (NDP forming)